jgi:uncharacterized protein YcbK (DUF882 family)
MTEQPPTSRRLATATGPGHAAARVPSAPSRRRLLGAALAAGCGALAAPAAFASATQAGPASASLPVASGGRAAVSPDVARLAFLNTHTGERVDVVYREAGELVPGALAEIDRALRDHRSGDVHPIDRPLLDLLHRLAATFDTPRPFHVISGYRSPASNARLAAASSGVAKHSLHLEGRAIDIRVPGVALRDLRQAALALRGGGVGFYPGSDFVHLDTGRLRAW